MKGMLYGDSLPRNSILLVMQSAAEANHFHFARRGCSPNRANPVSTGSLWCAAGRKNATFRAEFQDR
jgi:hypothetical protein